MTLLRLEFFKGRRRKIAILCLACLGIQTAWMVVDLLRMEPEELAQGWMQLVYTLLLVDAITLPLTMAALASRTCELEHKENTWKLLETLVRPQALYRAKLTWGAILILGMLVVEMALFVCFGLALVLDLVVITRVIPNRPRLLPIFVKPAIASAIMGGAAWAVYGLLSRVLTAEQVNEAGETIRVVSRMGNALGIFLAIAVAGVVYLVLVVAIRAISKDDLALMPKGDKLARLLRL